MKGFKRCFSIIMCVALLCVSAFPAFAAGDSTPDDGVVTEEYVFDINSDSGIMPIADVDQTFTMTDDHRGGDRKYSGNRLYYAITITDVNGNPTDSVVSVQLHDYNSPSSLVDLHVEANGSTSMVSDIAITKNRTYYFYYDILSGSVRTLKVHMRITAYNE